MIALVVTVACLPLLVLDVMGGHGGGAREATAVDTEVPEPSLVVAVGPSDAPPSTAPSTTVATAPATTDATTATTAPTKKTTTTTAPAPAGIAKATPPTTSAPRVATPAPVTGPSPTSSESSFLACVRQRESHGDYTAVDPSGTYMGAYQIYQGGWDTIARGMGRSDLVGVKPNHASPADQDAVALQMLRLYGRSPWGGACG